MTTELLHLFFLYYAYTEKAITPLGRILFLHKSSYSLPNCVYLVRQQDSCEIHNARIMGKSISLALS